MRKILSWMIAVVIAVGGAGLAEAGWEEGVAAFQAKDYETAAAEFSTFVEEQPEYVGGQIMLAQSLRKLGRHDEALQHFRKAYELEPANLSYQLALSQGYLSVKRYGDAAQMLQKIDPGKLPAAQRDEYQQMLASALERSGNSEAALAALKSLTQTAPESADAWYRYGTAAFNAGDTAAGVAALEKAVSLDGEDLRKREALAKALVRQARETQGAAKKGIYDKAVRVASDLATQQPTYDHLLLLGEFQLGAGQYREAVASLKQAAAADAGSWLPHYYMAQAYTLLADYDNTDSAARAALERVESDKERQMVWKQIGFAREKKRDYDGAKEAYLQAGDPQSASRVDENRRIASENQEIEAENRQIEEMEAERRRLEEELRELGGPPRR